MAQAAEAAVRVVPDEWEALDCTIALDTAASSGRMAWVRAVCELPLHRGVDVGGADSNALRVAAQRGHTDVVRYLCELPLSRGVDPGADHN